MEAQDGAQCVQYPKRKALQGELRRKSQTGGRVLRGLHLLRCPGPGPPRVLLRWKLALRHGRWRKYVSWGEGVVYEHEEEREKHAGLG